MPRACDPQLRHEIVLDSDKGKDNPPTFIAKNLSCREWKEVASVSDQMDVTNGMAGIESLFTALRIGIVDWRNMTDRNGEPVEFSQPMFEHVLDPAEANELLAKVLAASALPSGVAKKSVSPSPSSTGSSAKSVPVEGA